MAARSILYVYLKTDYSSGELNVSRSTCTKASQAKQVSNATISEAAKSHSWVWKHLKCGLL